MIYDCKSSIFDSDAYGINTDLPESASEIIENSLRKKDEEDIRNSMRDWARSLATDFFNTETWGDEEWDAWIDKARELML